MRASRLVSSESTGRFEREIYHSTADIRLSPRGRKLLCSASAAIEAAIEAAIARPPGLDADGWLRVTIPIESIGHATGQLLSLGTDAEVLGPPELRARVRDTARAVAAQYGRRAAPTRPRPRPRPRKLA
jgi:predicted DNA-binding transcriptional regulator YafY